MADTYAPGASDIDLNKIFAEFGYSPTQAELTSMQSAFGGANNAATKAAGVSAIGQYVNYMNQMKKFEESDPLTALQTRMNNMVDQNQAAVQNLSKQLQDTLSSAPQLFGSLAPDQIQEYLAPLKSSFDQPMASVQSTMASRGLGAGSTEANALAQTGQQFNQVVLQQGLNIGMTAQTNKANALQAQINNLFGQTGTAMSISGNAASQQSKQNLGTSQLIGSLPSVLSAQALQQGAFNTQATSGGGFQDTFNQVTGDIGKATSAAGKLYAAYQTSGASSFFDSTATTFSSPNSPTGAPTSGIPSSSYKSPNLNASGYNSYGTDPITGRPTNQMFE